MSKFCTKCGTPLEEGIKCSCGQDSIENPKKYATLLIEITQKMVLKPVDTIKQYSKKENFKFGSIAILIASILFSILLYCCLKEGMTVFGNQTLFRNSLELSFLKTFLQGLFFICISFITTIFTIDILVTYVLKEKMEWKKITAMVGVCSTFTIPTTFFAMLFVFISLKITILIFGIATLFYFTFLYQGISEIVHINKNKLPYLFVLTISITAFVTFYLLPAILY